MIRGWLDRGVDGFRLDVFNVFYKAADLASNPPARPGPRGWGRMRAWNHQDHINDKDQPELGDLLREFRAIVDERPGRMTVGELFAGPPALAARYAEPGHLIFDFRLLERPWRAEAMAEAIDERETAFGPDRWPAVVLSNHDQPRAATRLSGGRPADRDAIARAAAVLLLTLRGTPFLYYGEEIGLGDIRVPRREIVDPPARRYWPLPLWWNRDGCRAPMPWMAGPNGGFTTGRPWVRMAPDVAIRNVATQDADPSSVLATYRRILEVRDALPALQTGGFRWVVRGRDGVLAYRRDVDGADGADGETRPVLVAINLTGKPVHVPVDDPDTTTTAWTPRLSTAGPLRPVIRDGLLGLRPDEAVILEG